MTYKDFEKLETKSLKDDFKNFKDTRGVYFLMLDEYVVYIGMSISSIYNRFVGSYGKEGHIHNKIFNKYKIMPLKNLHEYEIKKIEYYYINLFNPIENVVSKHQRFISDLPKDYIDKSKKGIDIYNNIIIERNKKLAIETFKYFTF